MFYTADRLFKVRENQQLANVELELLADLNWKLVKPKMAVIVVGCRATTPFKVPVQTAVLKNHRGNKYVNDLTVL